MIKLVSLLVGILVFSGVSGVQATEPITSGAEILLVESLALEVANAEMMTCEMKAQLAQTMFAGDPVKIAAASECGEYPNCISRVTCIAKRFVCACMKNDFFKLCVNTCTDAPCE